MRQLIQLRWIAVVGQLVTIIVVHFGMGVSLPTGPLLGVVGLLALANLAGTLMLRRHRVTDLEFLLALLFDVGTLTTQLYLTGGADNPFTALYLVQVVLGAILLRTGLVWILALATTACFALLTYRHRPLLFPPGLLGEVTDLYTLGRWLSFALVAMLLVMFITRISRNLRAREAYLAAMRQHAAEEDHIVRMGLFASGAAHELGTPLASLSVILSDWQRMPKLADDPELMGELREMQAEVQRCKSIVTEILHSAGEPRSETMGSIDPCTFVEELAKAWQIAHPLMPLICDCSLSTGPVMVGDPALRQAVWNLLENAADVSPRRVHLLAAQRGDRLVLAVRDHGPGFSPEMLRHFGQPYRSSKGAGHGVGLFLVVTVARRLGGRVETTNLPEGGAEVRLLIPLAPAHGRQA
ncbi:sensor histidine kinase [Roseomonas sp. KE2513]|uniref:ATP-binding protein n=1 Tax=Roseomonas sp. KE2513 TaxID=2479202 RepID=UPI0018DF23BB|nr:ATP-binding protein [Roseomonas sp. KE2513]MBI0537763.1 sensor histidine kinase [Roseomonas sp. KE2513]